jgi:hypothetical protein
MLGQPLGGGKVGDFDVHVETPKVAEVGLQWRDPPLR